jgi:ADP-heptose:LPS heptosyltransferase
MPILSQAVGTPSVTVFGGYEDGRSFQGGAHLAPHLAIQPIHPCPCFRHEHSCDKTLNIDAELLRLSQFLNEQA